MHDDEFTAWYQGSYRRVATAVSLHVGDHALARDATDEGYARALERWGRVGSMANREGWVFRVAVNVARRHGRRQGRERESAGSTTTAATPPADHQVDVELWSAVASLTERQRSVVVLRYVLDLTQADIAEALGIADGTVAATLHQARSRLRELLGPVGDREGSGRG